MKTYVEQQNKTKVYKQQKSEREAEEEKSSKFLTPISYVISLPQPSTPTIKVQSPS